MIATYIKELLFEQDCVVIPEFGGFIANYVSADIHPIRHTFIPPSKSIAFNEMLRLNDGLLSSYVAQQEGISRDAALVRIKEFTQSIREELARNKKYRLEEIGTLFLSQEQKIQFEPENRVNYFNDSFGLPELLYKPIERNAPVRSSNPFGKRASTPARLKDRASMPNEDYLTREESELAAEMASRRTSRLWLYVAVPLVLLVTTSTGLFLFYDDGNTALSSFNPFTPLYTRQRTVAPVAIEQAPVAPAPVEDTVAEVPAATAPVGEEAQAVSSLPDSNVAATFPETTTTPEVKAPETVASAPKETAPVAEQPTVTADGVAIPTDMPRYYVIVGSFSSRRNAVKLQRKLNKKGILDSKLILPKVESNLHKVSFADYTTLQEAATKAETLKGEFGTEVWVFKYVK